MIFTGPENSNLKLKHFHHVVIIYVEGKIELKWYLWENLPHEVFTYISTTVENQ